MNNLPQKFSPLIRISLAGKVKRFQKMGEYGSTRDQSSTQTTRLDEAIALISSITFASHSIRVFFAKWQSIRNRAEELFSSLTAIKNSETTDIHSLAINLDSILDTLYKCEALANQCLENSYTGRLFMQSDLDIASAKLDAHINSISDIYAVGLLSQSDAIVVRRPRVSSSRDDVRFYVVDLLTRFKIGICTEMTKQALVDFNDLVQEDERCIRIALEIDNVIGFLVNFLDFGDCEIQEEAAKSVSLIAGFQCYKSVLVVAGVIASLIRVLEYGSEKGKEFSARCLMKVTEKSDNARAVSAHGGVTALLNICDKNVDAELIPFACGVLKNLVGITEIKRFVVEQGAISLFLDLARSKDEVIKISSLDLLQTMALGDESIREMIIQGGGIRALVRVLDPKSSYSLKTRDMAFRGIVNICSSGSSLNLLINYGFMDHVLYLLRYGDSSVQELALKASFWLSGTSEEGKEVMGDAGFMPVLVKFLDSASIELREIAAETIFSMIVLPKNRKKFVQNDQNVGLLLQKLDPGKENVGNKELLLSILMSLTSSNSARMKIAISGYLKNIEKLAEAEVLDAKKIVRKLTSNRLSSMFNGLWHS